MSPQNLKNWFPFLAVLFTLQVGKGQSIDIGTTTTPIGSGARALGQGNAFIAVADDATAASWNPAGLAQLQTPELSLAGELLFSRESLSSSDTGFDSEDRNLDLRALNFGSLVFPFSLDNYHVVFSLNYLTLYRFEKQAKLDNIIVFPTGNRLNQHLRFSQEGSFSSWTPALAIHIHEKFSFGLSMNIWNHTLTGASEFEKKQFIELTSSNLQNFFIKDHFVVDEGYSFVFGGIVHVTESMNIGFVIKPNFSLDLDHKLHFENLDSTQPTPSQFTSIFHSDLEFPIIIGSGFSWRPFDSLTLSMDVTWTDWSDYILRENNEKFNPVTGRSTKEGKLDDTITVRIGCEYLRIIDDFILPLRVGFGYDPAPALGEVDEFYTINLGTGVKIGKYNFDIAYEFRWGNNVFGSLFQSVNATQDVRQHRILTSLIYYF